MAILLRLLGVDVSLGSYRSQVIQATKKDADLQKKVGDQRAKIAKLKGELGAIQRSITKYTTASSVQSKQRQIESKEKELAKAEEQLGALLKQRASNFDDLTRYTQNKERAEAQEQKKLDAEAKKRRDGESQHAKELTREAERRARIEARVLFSPVQLAQLPTKIKVLFLAANPLDTISPKHPPLRLDEESRAIREKIRASEHRDSVDLIPWFAARTDDLLQGLNEHKPHVVHFSGHGSEDGDLLFQKADGSTRRVPKAAIVATMRTIAETDNLRLVIFNACFSAAQAKAITEHIDVAIGMNDAIDDDAARAFAAQLYSAIGFGRSVQAAFAQAKAAIMLEGIDEEDTPQLYAREGVDPAAIVLVRPGSV